MPEPYLVQVMISGVHFQSIGPVTEQQLKYLTEVSKGWLQFSTTPYTKDDDEPKGANSYQIAGSHYKTAIEHWDFVIANQIPYMEAVIIKYLMRHGKKNGLEDLQKAKHYLDKLIEVETAKQENK